MVRVSGRRLGHKDVSSSTRQRRNDTDELTKRTGTHSQKMNLWLPGGELGDRTVREIGRDVYTLLSLKRRTSEDLL